MIRPSYANSAGRQVRLDNMGYVWTALQRVAHEFARRGSAGLFEASVGRPPELHLIVAGLLLL